MRKESLKQNTGCGIFQTDTRLKAIQRMKFYNVSISQKTTTETWAKGWAPDPQ